MTPALEPCPYAPKKTRKAHNLCVIVLATAKHPATLFCDRCGMSTQLRMTHPRPADDIVADALAILTPR